MCGTEIRYAHHMVHSDHRPLDVGCVCAEKMEEDKLAASAREKPLRSMAQRRSAWRRRNWKRSKGGNLYTNYRGWNIVVFSRQGKWFCRISARSEWDDRRLISSPYGSEYEAQQAAFNGLEKLRRRGKGFH